LEQYRDFLPTLFGVSEVDVRTSGPSASAKASADKQDPKTSGGPQIVVEKAAGTKCERCWRYVPSVSDRGLCPRCVEALAEPVSL
jgi:isoleucyl-tRNA synthetase